MRMDCLKAMTGKRRQYEIQCRKYIRIEMRENMKKTKSYIIRAICCILMLTLIVILGINIYIKGGETTEAADNFNKYLTSRNWVSSNDKGGGYMEYGKDGSFNYWGFNDGNGPWGYDIYDSYVYNSRLGTIKVTDGSRSVDIKVLSYNLFSMILEIEGYQVEFRGEVSEDFEADYINVREGKYMYNAEKEYIAGNYCYCNILEHNKDKIKCTIDGYEGDELGYVYYPISDKLSYEQLTITEVWNKEKQSYEYDTVHKNIEHTDAVRLLSEQGVTEYIWCDEDGKVDKIMFYTVVWNDTMKGD